MTEIIIVSDNHGNADILQQILAHYPNADAYIHCGDSELPPSMTQPFRVVTGNTDTHLGYPEMSVIDVKGIRCLITHSHTLPFGKTHETLVYQALEKGCTVACYGHTHRPFFQEINGVLVINPGSLAYNRDGSMESYGRLVFEDGRYDYQLHRVSDLNRSI